LSAVSTSREWRPNGNASAIARIAPLALAVNTTSYWSGSAPTNWSVSIRARSMTAVLASDGPLAACGLPRTAASRRRASRRTNEAGYSAAPV